MNNLCANGCDVLDKELNVLLWSTALHTEMKCNLLRLHSIHIIHITFTSNNNNNTCLMAHCLGLPRWAGTRNIKTNLDLLEQETVSGSGSRWAICKSTPCPTQITTPAPITQVFYSWMHFLPPNQQCQSTEGRYLPVVVMYYYSIQITITSTKLHYYCNITGFALDPFSAYCNACFPFPSSFPSTFH